MSSPFNAPRNYSAYGGKVNDKHEGIDTAPTDGAAEVLAVVDGVVTKVSSSAGYGNYCIVASTYQGVAYSVWRAHMATVSVKEGQQVKKGDVLGICGSTGNATGKHDHLTMQSPAVGMSGYIVPSVVDPTPYYPKPYTIPDTFDLLPYLKGDGRIYGMSVLWQGQEHYQQMQTQVEGNRFYTVKNAEWEEFYSEDVFIYRARDTSPGNGEYYWQREYDWLGARWCPRHWRTGGSYYRVPTVTFYRKDTGKKTAGPTVAPSWLKLAALHSTWRGVRGPVFNDVVQLVWSWQQNGAALETYYYARNVGLVGWQSSSGDLSWVVEVFDPGERQPIARETVHPPA